MISWDDVLSDTNKLQLKITDKWTQDYIGEVTLMKLFVNKLKRGMQVEAFWTGV